MKKENELKLANQQVEKMIDRVNVHIDILGDFSKDLYNTLTEIQTEFDSIRNIPTPHIKEFEQLKSLRSEWRQLAQQIEQDYNHTVKKAGAGAAGVGAGVGVAALGPAAAMGIATTIGVASTGTPIAVLNGAAATNAALAWLGGALAAGGGGVAAGQAILALAGPIGWTLAGAAFLYSGYKIINGMKDYKETASVFVSISHQATTRYGLAILELKERIRHIVKETAELKIASEIVKAFGTDYEVMSEEQQYQLGAYVNLMYASTQLLVNPILGLTPPVTEKDIDVYASQLEATNEQLQVIEKYKGWVVYLANLIYGITLDEKGQKLLLNTLKNQKELLNSFDIQKQELTMEQLQVAQEVVNYQRMFEY